jgi:hypothetical protein
MNFEDVATYSEQLEIPLTKRIPRRGAQFARSAKIDGGRLWGEMGASRATLATQAT